MTYLKVEGHENLYRDPNTGAIISKQSTQKHIVSETIMHMMSDINMLKNEIKEIKSLLKLLSE
jgi:hypothetical protein